MLALPLFTCYAWICLTRFGGALALPTSGAEWRALAAAVPAPSGVAVALYGAWLLWQVALSLALPGRIAVGPPLADGSRLPYRTNGWLSFWATAGGVAVAVALGWIPPTVLYDELGPLLTTVNLVAFVLGLLLYLRGRASGAARGHPVRDYFMGTSLNPRVGGLDLKFFCAGRPGLTLWMLIDLSMAAKQHELHGTVTTPMILVNAFQILYIADYFFHEEAILTTWDMRHEKFGWMLCWGDLVWVPFVYSLQAQYLVHHPHELSTPATVGIVALNLAGYAVFRAANLQKHRFRLDPRRPIWGRRPRHIATARGPLLLASGWWGIVRHPNYLGDLAMGLAWCLPTGFRHPLPYFYAVYLAVLLVHRERRDHAACRRNYGRDWEAYCRQVRWRLLPGVY
jgi:protein-S-isoprenylcysteine O-methyltransferase Ste14